jgi:hypothetical protein
MIRLLNDTLLNGWFCIGVSITIWILKGFGIFGFLPGWPSILFAILAMCNFIVKVVIQPPP